MKQSNQLGAPKFSPVRKVRYCYIPVQETLTSEELGTYTTFSLSVRTTEEEIAFVSDISTDFEEVRHLAELCTEKQLDPEQLPDVLEDFLVECTVPTV